MAEDKSLHVSVITPAKPVYDGEAVSVVVPAFDGELGVLPGHASMLALLGTGELRVTATDGTLSRLAVRGGFLQIHQNKVTVLSQESLMAEDIAAESLAAEIKKLDAEKPTKLEEREALEAKRAWAKVRQRVSLGMGLVQKAS
ncbi:MAG: ATP synthase F1 subunit epsilon [Planctomycetota bacterium]